MLMRKSRGSWSIGKVALGGVIVVAVFLWYIAASRLFGDPSGNTGGHVGGSSHFEHCADHAHTCTCPKHHVVRYGADGHYVKRSVCSTVAPFLCDDTTFGTVGGKNAICECSASPQESSAAECLDSVCHDFSPDCSSLTRSGRCISDAVVHATCRHSCGVCVSSVQSAVKESPPLKPVVGVSEKSIKYQVELMKQEPHVDPTRMRREAEEKYPDGNRPNPMPRACSKQKHDGTEKLLAKAVISPKQDTPRILCLSYTMHTKQEALKTIKDTFGPECNGFLFMSTETDPETNEIRVHHVGPEEYNNMWQKSRSIWAYVNDLEEQDHKYDFFCIGGDDLYFVIDNLRAYLGGDAIRTAGGGENWPKPLFIGRRFKGFDGKMFNSGGAGYVLNRAAVKLLSDRLDGNECSPRLKHFSEDREVGLCLRGAGVLPVDTKDEKGEERFMPFTPETHYHYRAANYKKDWYKDYAIDLREGLESMSSQVVSFHYLKPDQMRRVHALLYHCKKSSIWRDVADEGAQFNCTKRARYSAPLCLQDIPTCTVHTQAGPFEGRCNNLDFGGDPAPGKMKICQCEI